MFSLLQDISDSASSMETNAQVQRTTSLQSTALQTCVTQRLTEKANVREVYVRLNRAI